MNKLADNRQGTQNQDHRPEIDGLRAIAILADIVSHFSKSARAGGQLGVDDSLSFLAYLSLRP